MHTYISIHLNFMCPFFFHVIFICRLSDKIARDAPCYTLTIFDEIVRWEKYFDTETKKHFFGLLPTWAENLFWVFSNDSSQGEELLQLLLTLTSTNVAVESECQLCAIWSSAVVNCDPGAIDFLSEFLVNEAEKSSENFNTVELIYTCKRKCLCTVYY